MVDGSRSVGRFSEITGSWSKLFKLALISVVRNFVFCKSSIGSRLVALAILSPAILPLMHPMRLARRITILRQGVRELDLEGVVAKWKAGAYIADNRRSSWVKIKNPNYSQIVGREELFEPR